jgi:hypothetical protein
MSAEPQASSQNDAVNASIAWVTKNILMIPLLAFCGWLAQSTQTSEIRLATLSEKVSSLQDQLKVSLDGRYTSDDASKDFRSRDALLADLATRVATIERRNMGLR